MERMALPSPYGANVICLLAIAVEANTDPHLQRHQRPIPSQWQRGTLRVQKIFAASGAAVRIEDGVTADAAACVMSGWPEEVAIGDGEEISRLWPSRYRDDWRGDESRLRNPRSDWRSQTEPRFRH